MLMQVNRLVESGLTQLRRAAEFAASEIPGAELIIYDAGGHLLVVGHKEAVRRAIRRFLDLLRPAGKVRLGSN
jgi:hypothetical protein